MTSTNPTTDQRNREALLEAWRTGRKAQSVIPRRPEGRSIPLSFAQQRLWFLENLFPGTAIYTMAGAIRLRGRIDIPALEGALRHVIERHETLRTSFAWRDGVPEQVIHPHSVTPVQSIDLRDRPDAERHAAAMTRVDELAKTHFDMSAALAKFDLIRVADDEVILGLALHHAIADRWSVSIFFRDLSAAYFALAAGRRIALPALPIQYADFAVWQRQQHAAAHRHRDLAYWQTVFESPPPLVTLMPDFARPTRPLYTGARESFVVPAEVLDRLRAIADASGSGAGTLFIVLMAAFKGLLHLYTGALDITVGTPIANRTRREVESLIGFFANTLALRTDMSGNPRFSELIQRERAVALAAYDHQELPFEYIVERVQPERNLNQSPLFRTVLVLQNSPRSTISADDITVEALDLHSGTAKFDLLMSLSEQDGGLKGTVEYDTQLYRPGAIQAFIRRYVRLLQAVGADPQCRIGDVDLLSRAEFDAVLARATHPRPQAACECMHRLFEDRVRAAPHAVALTAGARRMTYAELNAASNRLAHRLRTLGVRSDTLVALHVSRNMNLVVGILGILKAGGAYVPLDPSYPIERIGLMLADSAARVLVTENERLDIVSRLRCGDVALANLDDPTLAGECAENPETEVAPHDLCYVIYTSGSTGRPKGTLIQHDSVHRLLTSTEHWFAFGPKDVWTLFHSYSFDFSVWELWGALAYGGRLVIVDADATRAPPDFYQLLIDEQVTVLNQTPSAFRQLMSVDETHGRRSELALRAIIFGGEALDIAALGPWFERHSDRVRLINMYGITETTVHVTYRELQAADVASAAGHLIGTPIPDLDIYLLDPAGRPVPDGMIGEIHVSGPGLARGYLHRPELTAERFLAPKFAPALRLYRSGDLARRLSTGDLDYLGRLDHQVKIRGFRVELGEIASALHRLEAVKDCAVIAREDVAGDPRIVAYVVPQLPETAPAQQDGAVSAWQSVFDRTYEHGRDDLPGDFNIVGWTSAYSGDAIPDEEMREWVDETVRSLLDLAPQRVLEIGCGTGLLLSRVAPHCAVYHGIDFSLEALESIRRNLLAHRPDLAHVELQQASATELNRVGEESFDLIVINSVAQYFPSIGYLVSVLDASLEKLAPGGVLFVGDVRSRELNLALHASIELQDGKDVSIAAWARAARENAEREPELLIDPMFFPAYAACRERVTQFQIRHKRGAASNELTRFRFDALLGVGGARIEAPQALQWPAPEAHPERLRAMLETAAPRSVLIREVPNARLRDVALISEALGSPSAFARSGELRAALKERTLMEGACDPQAFLTIADTLPYEVSVLCRPGDPLRFDVALQRRAPAAAALSPADRMVRPGQSNPAECNAPLERYANQPLRVRLRDQLVADLDEKLSASLPAFMVPAAYVLLDELPINENGKLDRKSLPPPPTRSAIASEYEAPRSDIERRVARLFSSVLGLRRVGRNADFFALGGHSLLAAQLMYQIRDSFGVEVSLQSVFASPTVSGIAALLGGERSAVSTIDLPREVHLDESIRPGATPCSGAPAARRGVLLTGATGFVGAFLLRSLLDRTDGPVRCLIRADGEHAARERVLRVFAAYRLPVGDLERMVPVVGDLSLPRFGLSPRQFEALGAGIEAIYHNGAAINFSFPYSAVKASNVGGTEEALRLAAAADAALHYVSTLYVYGRHDAGGGIITESTVPEDWADLRMGYTQSKWVAERLLDLAHERGLRTSIYRLGRICGSTETGAGPEHDLFWHVIRLGLQFGVMPDIDFPLDLTPVNFVADSIVSLAQGAQERRHFHLHNPHGLHGRRVLRVLARLGWQFDTVPIGRWGEILAEHSSSMSPTDPGYGIAGLLGTGDALASALRFSSTETQACLAARGLACPEIGEELLERYLKYFVTVGHLKAPEDSRRLEPVCP